MGGANGGCGVEEAEVDAWVALWSSDHSFGPRRVEVDTTSPYGPLESTTPRREDRGPINNHTARLRTDSASQTGCSGDPEGMLGQAVTSL